MNDNLQDLIRETLKKVYCRAEDAIGESDMTKDQFKELERDMEQVANSVGLEPYYPFEVKLT